MQSIQYIPVIFVITTTSSMLMDFKNNQTNTGDFFTKAATDCTAFITYKHIPCGTLITFVSTVTNMEPLHKLLSERNCYHVINRSFQKQNYLIWPDFYITSMKNTSQFYTNFIDLPKHEDWNPKALFIIIIYNMKSSEFNAVFKILWKLNIFNIILMAETENGKFEINTYDPFANNTCGRSVGSAINIKDCEDIHNVRSNYDHLEVKYRNCTITVSGAEDIPNFIDPKNKEYSYLQNNLGLEQYILSNFAKRENITLEYIIVEPELGYGVVLPNWTATGQLGYLQNNSASIAIGGFLVMLNRIKLFDFICGHSYSAFLLIAPSHGEVYWIKVYQQFGGLIWIIIALSYLCISCLTILTGRYFMGITDAKRIALILWGYIFGNTNEKLLRLNKLRRITIVWIWFTFFITSFYSTVLYKMLTTKTVEKVEYTDRPLESVPLKPCISDNTRTFFEYNYNYSLPGQSIRQCKTISDVFDTVGESNDFFALEMDYCYRIREFKYIDSDGHHKLDIFQFTNNIMAAIYVTRGFPLKAKLQRYANYHMEAGLLINQAAIINHRFNMFNKHYSHSFKNLSLPDLRIPYIILALGYIISLISFAIEMKSRN